MNIKYNFSHDFVRQSTKWQFCYDILTELTEDCDCNQDSSISQDSQTAVIVTLATVRMSSSVLEDHLFEKMLDSTPKVKKRYVLVTMMTN